ncbi:hypothetical protein [Baekduia sp. Peel2402]|uniref:hypothetical protein n=1 Tax=Baekduia sp. Peel2402 TaxID=3458296 RepID=UPI00403E6C31
MNIRLDLRGTPDQVRKALATVAKQLGPDGQVMAEITEQGEDVIHRSVTVAVFSASIEADALTRIQPAARAADSDLRVIVGGDSVMQMVIP